MKEIDSLLFELSHLFRQVKASKGKEGPEVHDRIQELFTKVRSLIQRVNDLQELERIRKVALSIGQLAGEIHIERALKAKKIKDQFRESRKELQARLEDLQQRGAFPHGS